MTTNEKAAVMLRARSTKDLIRDFVLTGAVMDSSHKTGKPYDPNLPTVRGWIMDEIERRDPEGFDAWMDSDLDDDGLYKFIRG